MDRRRRGPPHDFSREQVQHHREVKPALPGSDVRDVGGPRDVRLRDRELALEQVGDQHRRLSDDPAARAIAVQRAQAVLAHQALDPVLATGLARLPQVEEHPRRAVDALARGERGADEAQQSCVLDGPIRQWTLDPRVVTAWRHTEDPAHHVGRKLLPVGLDKGVLCADASSLGICRHLLPRSL